MEKEKMSEKCIGAVRVGPKGQVVIPKEIRDMFGIKPGDSLVILADKEKGIAIERMNVFNKIADAIFAGKSQEIYPDVSEEDAMSFARGIKSLNGKDDK
ncbi:MAG TPA: AbrB/MazE/SpoVT family DNA-binding domain-containing protein [Candidatus Izemoplasmatales bacterium]|nr:AbrB/MazE/SpoVT family DNA-binding domain-containing protein [Candidatus Izemoplasmatales bacterium]